MVKKISVIDIKNEANDEALDISDDSQSEEEKVNLVEFNPTTVAKTKKENDNTTKQITVEQHQCSDCLKFMSLKSLRYSHAKYCTAKFDQNPQSWKRYQQILNLKIEYQRLKMNTKICVKLNPTHQCINTNLDRFKLLHVARNRLE